MFFYCLNMMFSSFLFLPLEFTGQLCHYPSFLTFFFSVWNFPTEQLRRKRVYIWITVPGYCTSWRGNMSRRQKLEVAVTVYLLLSSESNRIMHACMLVLNVFSSLLHSLEFQLLNGIIQWTGLLTSINAINKILYRHA